MGARHWLRAAVQGFVAAIILAKALFQPVVYPAEAGFMRLPKNVLIADVSVEPEKAAPGLNASSLVQRDWCFERGVFLEVRKTRHPRFHVLLPEFAKGFIIK